MPRSKEELERAAAEAEAWLDQLDPDDPAVTVSSTADLRTIALALASVASAESALAAAVQAARANGRSWSRIGIALGVSKQAALKRFGEPAVPRQSGA